MFSFFCARDRWKWDLAKGVPPKKVVKLMRQTLRSGGTDEKKRLLAHISDLAEASTEIKSAFCDGKVTADVCWCLLLDVPTVQEAAAEALAFLCDHDPANCEAAISAHFDAANCKAADPVHQAARSGSLRVVPHALKLVQSFDKAPDLAITAASLLDVLATTAPEPVTQLILQSGGISSILAVVQACSRGSLDSATPAARSSKLLELLQQLLTLLRTLEAGGGPPVCRELGKSRGLGLLLELTQDHRGQRPGDGAGDHAAVVRDALRLLESITTRVPAHRLPFLEADGVKRLLAVLRDLSLAWSVRLNAAAALQAAAASATVVAELVKAGGLTAVFLMVDAFVSGRQVPGAPGVALTPPRGAPVGTPGGAASLASPSTPFGASAPPMGSPAGSACSPGGEEAEPRTVEVVEQLLGLVGAVADSPDAPAVLEGNRVMTLLAAFNSGMANFSGGGYRVATTSAQVLFRLSLRSGTTLPPSLCSQHVTGPLSALVDRGLDYVPPADAKQAQMLHGAWCAAGLLCQVWDAARTQGKVREVLHGGSLRAAVKLLDASAPALLVAVSALEKPMAATPLELAGLIFLSTDRVKADLSAAASKLMALLMELAGDTANRAALIGMGAATAAKQLLAWRQVQWYAKRLLHLLGIMEAEYQPFARYGCGPLLEALLSKEGVDPAPFLTRRVDAHLLLDMDDQDLRSQLRLDEVAVRKVARIRSAHSLFAAMDAEDGRMDGCVSEADVVSYLTNSGNMRNDTAVDLQKRLFQDLQVLPGEPICFMQFVSCFPWLDVELQAFMPHRLAPAGAGEHFSVRSAKRQRFAGPGGNGNNGNGNAGGSSVIEVD